MGQTNTVRMSRAIVSLNGQRTGNGDEVKWFVRRAVDEASKFEGEAELRFTLTFLFFSFS